MASLDNIMVLQRWYTARRYTPVNGIRIAIDQAMLASLICPHSYFTMAPRIPAAKSTETLCYGVATVGAFLPIYLMLPGAEQRLAMQTTKWAPRWERNISYFTPAAERGIKRVEPPVSRIVKRIDDRLPLEKMAKGIDKRIKNGIERFNNTK
ncbi:hypothetical protein Brms1b_013437 [Colletotrichum noveboracense]|nr:hypothetical protein Brms1b_013437 [Colletotrichum noveboracense]